MGYAHNESVIAARIKNILRHQGVLWTLEPIIREARDQVRDGANYIFDVWKFPKAGEWPNVWE